MSAPLLLRLIIWPWIAAAFYAGHSLLLQRLPPIAVPAIVLLLTTSILMAYLRLETLRLWIDSLDLRRLLLLHVTRFVGVVFLLLHHRGELPYAFAIPAGIGDLIVATAALSLALAPLHESTRRRALSIWNAVGLFDLLFVIANAVRITRASPEALRPLTELPLSLLPTFLVPWLLATHVIIFIRLAREGRPS